jgi:cation diffusion facilitator family transporter
MSNRNKYWYAKIEGWMSLIGNILLFVVKYWAGVVSGSVAMIADAWHTLSDSFSSVIVLIGVKIAQKPPDQEHPFGHGRAESIASIVVGVLLIMVGINFVFQGFERLIEREEAYFGKMAIIVTIISMVVKEIMAQISIRWGKRFKLQSLISDGWHHRSDAISSLVILVGIFAGPHIWWIDGVLGMAVGLLIGYSGLVILNQTFKPLLGENPDSDLTRQINAIGLSVCNADIHLHHVHIHNYGDHSEITFHMRLPGVMPLRDTYMLTSALRRRLKRDLNLNATIYLEPIDHIFDSLEYISFSYNDHELMEIASKIRHDTFVIEQKVDENIEFDGLDEQCQHFLVKYNERFLATARCRTTTQGIKIERFAVVRDYRSSHIGTFLLNKMKAELQPKKLLLYLHAQDSAVDFYKKHGFGIQGDSFEEANIVHYKMSLQP